MSNNVNNYFEQAGSDGDNKLVLGGSVETDGGANLKSYVMNARIADVSTAGQVYVAVPINGTLVTVYSALGGAISGADAELTVKTAAGTAGTITIAQSGSAAGDVDSLTVASNGAVTAGQTIEIETGGESTGTQEVVLTLVISAA